MRVVKNVLKTPIIGRYYKVVDYVDRENPEVIYPRFHVGHLNVCNDNICMYWQACTRTIVHGDAIGICGLDDGRRREWREIDESSGE